MRYLEFAVASNFSFLRGASHPEELMREMPELASDLDVSARGSAHAPTRRAN